MPRINVEDDLETHDQFFDLLPLVANDRDAAIGKLVRFFRLAQKRFVEERPVTMADLESAKLTCMVESGWAVPVEGGYQVKNAEEHFEWLTTLHETAVTAGKARAKNARRDERGRLLPAEPQPKSSVVQHPLVTVQRPPASLRASRRSP